MLKHLKKSSRPSQRSYSCFLIMNKLHQRQSQSVHVVRSQSTALRILPEINGEKANDVTVGLIVLLSNEKIPKTRPTKQPSFVPKTMAAMMTGICSVVALKGPIGMNPKKGTITSNASIAIKRARYVIRFVLCFLELNVFSIFNFSSTAVLTDTALPI